MREVKYTTRFQRDHRREKSGRHGKKLGRLADGGRQPARRRYPAAAPNFRSPTVRRMERSPRGLRVARTERRQARRCPGSFWKALFVVEEFGMIQVGTLDVGCG